MKVIDRNGAATLIQIMKHLDLQVENKIPSIEGLASEEWVLEKGYLDAEASKAIHYTKKETDHHFFHKSDLSHLATKSWVHTHMYDKSEADNRFITPSTLRDYWTKADVVMALEQLRSQIADQIAQLATYEKIYELFFTKEQTLLELDKIEDNLNDALSTTKDTLHKEIDSLKDNLNNSLANNLSEINKVKDELHNDIDGIKDNLYNELNEIKDGIRNELGGDHYTKAETLVEIDKVRDELIDEINKKSDTAKLYDIFFTKAQTLLEIDHLRDTIEQWLHKYALKEDYYSKEHIDKVLWELLVKGNVEGTIDIDFESLAKVPWVRENFVKKEENSLVKDERGNLIPELFIDPDITLVDESRLDEYVRKDENSIIKDEQGNIIPILTVDPDAEYVQADDLIDFATKKELEEVKNSIPTTEKFVSIEAINEINQKLEDYARLEDLPTDYLTDDDIKDFITEEALKPYATKSELEEVKQSIPSIEGLASEKWVESKGYLTQHQDISNLATKDEVNDVENKIPSLEGYATEEWVEDKGYLVENDLSPYAKKKDLENYYNKEEVDKKITDAVTEGKVDLTGYATEKWVKEQEYLTQHQDISHLATKEELDEVKESIPDDYLTEEDIQGFVKEESLESYVSKEDFEEYKETVPTIEDIKSQLDDFATKQYVNDEINKLTKVVCLTEDEFENLGDAFDNNTFYIIYEEQ